MSRAIALALLLAAPRAAFAGPGEWEHVTTGDGIRVDRRAWEGYSLHEFRARGVVPAPLQRVLGVLSDAPRRVEWMERCVQSYLIEQLGETGQVAYNRTKGTWPVSDRDVVVRGETHFLPTKRRIRIDFRAVRHESAPRRDDAVRITFLRGHWLLQPVGDGNSTFVEYQAHVDPAGSLPDFVINLVSKRIPYNTLLKLQHQVKVAKYPELEARLLADPRFQQVLYGRELTGSGHPGARPTPGDN